MTDIQFARIKNIILLLSLFIGLTTQIVNFLRLWQGDQETVTWVLGSIGFVLVVCVLSYVSFSRKKSAIAKTKFVHRFPGYSTSARILLSLIVVMSCAGILWVHHQNTILRNKFIILVADFDGPNIKRYGVTELLFQQLHLTLDEDHDVVVKKLGGTISEEEGRKAALKAGEKYFADLVLWGWYAATGTSMTITMHVENLSHALTHEKARSYVLQGDLAAIETFTAQYMLSGEASALALYVGALTRFQSKDYAGTIERLNRLINSNSFGSKDVERDLHFYRGNSFFFLKNFQDAVSDYSKIVEIGLADAPVYNNRAICFSNLKEYDKAISDLDEAIRRDSTLAEAYSNRGYAHVMLKQFKAAITDWTLSIKLGFTRPETYFNRGKAYREVRAYDNSRADLNMAI